MSQCKERQSQAAEKTQLQVDVERNSLFNAPNRSVSTGEKQ
jgi:hypothetical protein